MPIKGIRPLFLRPSTLPGKKETGATPQSDAHAADYCIGSLFFKRILTAFSCLFRPIDRDLYDHLHPRCTSGWNLAILIGGTHNRANSSISYLFNFNLTWVKNFRIYKPLSFQESWHLTKGILTHLIARKNIS